MGERSDETTKFRTNNLTSFKNRDVMTKQSAQNTAENRQGRRYGYSFQNQFPNRTGNLSCGRESNPPAQGLLDWCESYTCFPPVVTYPIVTPTAHTRGMSPDTWARFVVSVSSVIMLLTTPMLPLSKPATQRLVGRSVMVLLRGGVSSTLLQGQ